MFACEKDPFARTTFEANNETEHFYRDITERNQEETPEVDLYVAGFPCQAFSLAGKQLGFEDVRGIGCSFPVLLPQGQMFEQLFRDATY